MREVLILFLILIIPLPAAAYSVKGTVIDGDSNKPVAGMTVGIEELNISTGTDRSGNFEFENIDAGYYHLVFSQLSYGIQKMKIRVKNNFSGSVKVWKRKYRIKDHVNRTAFRSERYGAQGITSRDIKDYPMRGMGDSLHLLQSLPGMGGNFALSTVPIIRGGNPLYDRYYVDGIPLDYPYHFSGALIPVMSAINESVIEEATVLKGLAPLNYGDNLGNVIKIKTRDVKEPGIHGSVMLDPLVPLIPTVAVTAVPTPDLSVIASVRRSMADLVVDFDDREIYIYDHFCKIEYNLFSKHRITFHSMAARDYLNINDIKGTSWYDMEALTWDYFIRKNILLKSTFSRYATIYHFDNGSADDAVNFSFDPEQYRLFQMALWTTGIFSVKGGYELTFYRGGASGNVDLNDLVDPDLLDLTGDSAALHFPLEGTSFALFSEGKGDLGKYWVQGGMRYEYYGPLGNHSLSFRSMAGYEFSKKLTIYGGTGLYHAHPDIYYYLGETSPSFEDARAWNTILGVTSRHIKYVTAQLEIYYNNFDNYPIGTVDVTNAAEYKSLVQLSPFSNEESGYAWGVEVYLKGAWKNYAGWISYSAGISRGKNEDQNLGTFDSDFSQTHLLRLVASARFGKFTPSVIWHLYSSLPYTPVTGSDGEEVQYGDRNSSRFDINHRLDFKLNYQFNEDTRFYLEIWNCYYHQGNEVFQYVDSDAPVGTDNPAVQNDFPPIFAWFGVEVSF